MSEACFHLPVMPQPRSASTQTYGVLPSKLRSGSDKEGGKTGVDVP